MPHGVSAKTTPWSGEALRSREISPASHHASKSARGNGGENLRPMLSANCSGLPSVRFCQIPSSFCTTWPFSSAMRTKRSIDGTNIPTLSACAAPVGYVDFLNDPLRLKLHEVQDALPIIGRANPHVASSSAVNCSGSRGSDLIGARCPFGAPLRRRQLCQVVLGVGNTLSSGALQPLACFLRV